MALNSLTPGNSSRFEFHVFRAKQILFAIYCDIQYVTVCYTILQPICSQLLQPTCSQFQLKPSETSLVSFFNYLEFILEEMETWSWGRGGVRPEPEASRDLEPWGRKWPPSWWPKPVLQDLIGSAREFAKDHHSKSFGAKEAYRDATNAIPRPGRFAGVGEDLDAWMEGDFPQPSTAKINYM